MCRLLEACLFCIVRWSIGLRYRVRCRGLDTIASELNRPGGTLFLPTHVAEIDPVILMTVLWPRFRPRPVVVEDFYYLSWIRRLMRLVGAVPCPNMEHTVNRWKMFQLEVLQKKIIEGLKQGQRYLIYPSGRLKLSAREALGGASLVPHVLQAYPDVNIVMVRITGLWGSSFSRALTGKVPSFEAVLWTGWKILWKNMVFFTPKREVLLEFVTAGTDFPYRGTRHEINRYLETWYNGGRAGAGDQLVLVPYSMWRRELSKVTEDRKAEPVWREADVPERLRADILAKLSELSQMSQEKILWEHQLFRDLGLDSLDIGQIVAFLDEQYHVREVVSEQLISVGDVMVVALPQRTEARAVTPAISFRRRKKERCRLPPSPPIGDTIPEAFLHCCRRMGGSFACVDGISGEWSYRRLKAAVWILANEMRALPGQYIGILLPSSVAVNLAILAAHFARKIPVMLNWTVGAKVLNHAADVTNIQIVLSSFRFLDRLRHVHLGELQERVVLLEDIYGTVSWGNRWRGIFAAMLPDAWWKKKLGLHHIRPEDIAVILFTSGTEALPKGVPLTHKNILSNQVAAMSVAKMETHDLFYAVLPPFHSFGFSITGLLPLLAGIQVAYAPDPTDGHGMAHGIEMYGATILCCAPTFLRGLFQVAQRGQLCSLRYIISGAEKATQDLFDYVDRLPHAQILEGYGITECSPIVTLTPPDLPRCGVGTPLPGVSLCVIDDKRQLCPRRQEGEICISGPNVFHGYLNKGSIDPFLHLDGVMWYRSGDRGYIDETGSLVLTGRLKRFVKIGAEMVSLGGIEMELHRMVREKEWHKDEDPRTAGPLLAVVGRERVAGKVELVIVTRLSLDKDAVNIGLKHRGYSNLIRFYEVRKVAAIPVLGTGKIDYRQLEKMVL